MWLLPRSCFVDRAGFEPAFVFLTVLPAAPPILIPA